MGLSCCVARGPSSSSAPSSRRHSNSQDHEREQDDCRSPTIHQLNPAPGTSGSAYSTQTNLHHRLNSTHSRMKSGISIHGRHSSKNYIHHHANSVGNGINIGGKATVAGKGVGQDAATEDVRFSFDQSDQHPHSDPALPSHHPQNTSVELAHFRNSSGHRLNVANGRITSSMSMGGGVAPGATKPISNPPSSASNSATSSARASKTGDKLNGAVVEEENESQTKVLPTVGSKSNGAQKQQQAQHVQQSKQAATRGGAAQKQQNQQSRPLQSRPGNLAGTGRHVRRHSAPSVSATSSSPTQSSVNSTSISSKAPPSVAVPSTNRQPQPPKQPPPIERPAKHDRVDKERAHAPRREPEEYDPDLNGRTLPVDGFRHSTLHRASAFAFNNISSPVQQGTSPNPNRNNSANLTALEFLVAMRTPVSCPPSIAHSPHGSPLNLSHLRSLSPTSLQSPPYSQRRLGTSSSLTVPDTRHSNHQPAAVAPSATVSMNSNGKSRADHHAAGSHDYSVSHPYSAGTPVQSPSNAQISSS